MVQLLMKAMQSCAKLSAHANRCLDSCGLAALLELSAR